MAVQATKDRRRLPSRSPSGSGPCVCLSTECPMALRAIKDRNRLVLQRSARWGFPSAPVTLSCDRKRQIRTIAVGANHE